MLNTNIEQEKTRRFPTPHIVIKYLNDGELWVANAYEDNTLLYVIATNEDKNNCIEATKAWRIKTGKDYEIKISPDDAVLEN